MPEQRDDPWKLLIWHTLSGLHGHPGTHFLLPGLLLPLAPPFGEVPNSRKGKIRSQYGSMENPQKGMQIRESNTGQVPKHRQQKIFFPGIRYKVTLFPLH
jgi:hypothetical protein